MANIETFTEAVQTYGVAESEIFQSIDLYEGYKGPLITFINCLNKLGTLVTFLFSNCHFELTIAFSKGYTCIKVVLTH